MISPFYLDTVSTQNTLKLEFVPCLPAIIPVTHSSSQLINDNPTLKGEYAIELLCKSLETSVPYQFYRKTYYEYTILTLSRFSLCAQTIPELYRAK